MRLVPVGTEVRVVNQPFVFGWHDGQLYMQPFDVLEDDTRDWKKAQKRLLTRSLAVKLQQQLKAHHEQVDWKLVSSLTLSPRGVPVPITIAGCERRADPRRCGTRAQRAARGLHLGWQVGSADG